MLKKYEEFKASCEKSLKKLKKKYKILKIKYFLLFVLPIFLLVLLFQTVKQLLKVKARELGTAAVNAAVTDTGNKDTAVNEEAAVNRDSAANKNAADSEKQ